MPSKGYILVTGGAGYIGSHTIVELLKENYTVVTVDNLVNCYAAENSKPESLLRVEKITGKCVPFHKVDIKDKGALDAIFKKVYLFIF